MAQFNVNNFFTGAGFSEWVAKIAQGESAQDAAAQVMNAVVDRLGPLMETGARWQYSKPCKDGYLVVRVTPSQAYYNAQRRYRKYA